MAQRLVRTLCPHCKKPGSLDDGLWEALVRPWSLPKPATIQAPCGCPECRNTGYLGRVGLYELLTLPPELRRLLRPDLDAADFRRRACELGMRPLRASAALQIAAGLTTFEEVVQVLPPLEED
jgi:general secretion pathway protein E